MITTGSKLLVGAVVSAAVSAVLFGLIDSDRAGTFGLIFAAIALALAAGVNLFTRDSNLSSMDPDNLVHAPAAQPPLPSSVWPLVAAFGAGLLLIGLVTMPIAFYLGLIVLAAAGAEWAIEAWSDGASSSRSFNSTLQSRMTHPLEFPILAAIAVGVVVYAFSRIMLVLSTVGSPIVFGALATLILLAGFVFANLRHARPAAIGGVIALAATGLVAGGVAGALSGEREFHAHETWAGFAEQGQCLQPEEVAADEHASQTVANKSNLMADVTLTKGGELEARTIGQSGVQNPVTFMKSNPSNVLFHNDSDAPRRLMLDLGTRPGASADAPGVAFQYCTAMVEPGGSQLMTFVIPASNVPTGTSYAFVVPGLDGPRVEVVVP